MKKPKRELIIITPVYNDWECLIDLSKSINESLKSTDIELLSLVALNDNSTFEFNNGDEVKISLPFHIVNLAINVGHQRAIAIGLCYVKEKFPSSDFVIVMDSDGEDLPKYIPELCNKAEQENKIVFAGRQERSESFFFKIGYYIYKSLFRLLTSQTIKFGNYSCIPSLMVPKIIVNPDLWNHYSASIIKSKLLFTYIPTKRGLRYNGKSKMNIQSLIIHGLSSIAVYADVVIAKTLIFIIIVLFMIFIATIILVGIRTLTDLAVPGWTSSILIALMNFAASLFSIILLLLLMQLNQRKQVFKPVSSFYKDYINSIQTHE